MKPTIVKKPNPITKTCICGRSYTLTMSNRLYECQCGLRTLYIPHTSKGYYGVDGSDDYSNEPEAIAPDVQAV
jgi:DNA-directed RNA polymerase subunit RPC12/RpoP